MRSLLRRYWTRLAATALAGCAATPLVWPSAISRASTDRASTHVEWPTHWDGRAMRPLALSDVEQRFAHQFPGALARFTDDDGRTLVLRQVHTPTRMLHPATDCFRATGYRIEQARLERDAQERLWRCFEAEREGRRLRVCERIEGPHGESYTDTSAWFWSASLGEQQGPWRAVTVVDAL